MRVLLALGLLLVGCSENTTAPKVSSGSHWLTCATTDDCLTDEAVSCDGEFCRDASDSKIAREIEGDIEALQVGDTWVFRSSAAVPDGIDAWHAGIPTIVSGCLLVGDTAVIWRTPQEGETQSLIAIAESGAASTIRVGGVSGPEQGGLVPPIVAAHCAPTSLWFANGDPVDFLDGGI